MQISQHGSGHNVCLQFVAGIALHHLVVFSQWLLTPVKTTMEHSRPAFRDLPRTGDAEPVDRGKICWEQLRTICARSILDWRHEMARRHALYRSTWRQLAEAATAIYIFISSKRQPNIIINTVTCSGDWDWQRTAEVHVKFHKWPSICGWFTRLCRKSKW